MVGESARHCCEDYMVVHGLMVDETTGICFVIAICTYVKGEMFYIIQENK